MSRSDLELVAYAGRRHATECIENASYLHDGDAPTTFDMTKSRTWSFLKTSTSGDNLTELETSETAGVSKLSSGGDSAILRFCNELMFTTARTSQSDPRHLTTPLSSPRSIALNPVVNSSVSRASATRTGILATPKDGSSAFGDQNCAIS
jgi:hypothetical protein